MFRFPRACRSPRDGCESHRPTIDRGCSKKSKRPYSTVPQTKETKLGRKKFTIRDINNKYEKKIPITMVTSYDYTSALAVEEAGIDVILVGDSLGMVMLGQKSTTSVTMDEMIHHCKAVQRGSQNAFLIGDMPFGSYETSPTDAVRNAIRLMKEGGVDAVKMEGGARIADSIRAVVNAGIPVMGHIGLTPQTSSALGGFRVQGKTAESAQAILKDATAVEAAGAFSVVVESVPAVLGSHVTFNLKIPTIGIGAGPQTSGQVLVFHDMMGMFPKVPKFAKTYADLWTPMTKALEDFKLEVENRKFPDLQHSYTMKEEEFSRAFPSVPMTDPFKIDQVEDFKLKEEKLETNSSEKFNPAIHVKEKKKSIAIIGGGAMGSLIGAKLASDSRNSVWMLSNWKDHVTSIKSRGGLTLTNFDGSQIFSPVNATSEISEILQVNGAVDLAMVMVKSPMTRDAAVKASKLIHPSHGMVLTLQNGLGNREIIGDVLGDVGKVIQGVTSQAGNILGQGMVTHTGEGYTTLAFSENNRAIVEELAAILNAGGIFTEISPDLEGMQWGKLIVNSAINPISAILGVKNGELAENSSTRELLGQTVKEGASVAQAKGVSLPFDVFQKVLDVARATAQNSSSMLKDVRRGTLTEVDAINGSIVREGDRLGVNVNLNRMLMGLINSSYQASQATSLIRW